MTGPSLLDAIRDLIRQANAAFHDGDTPRYEDLNEQIRIMCDEHPELIAHANAAGIYGGGPA